MPATVKAGVVVLLATEIRPPVKLTSVTVPVPPTETQDVTPEPFVESTKPLVPAVVGSVSVHAALVEFEDWSVTGNAPAAVLARINCPWVVC